jgi:hypothetical protein
MTLLIFATTLNPFLFVPRNYIAKVPRQVSESVTANRQRALAVANLIQPKI